MAEDVHIHRQENPDSITIGTPGRGGEIKIYFNSMDTREAEERLINAIRLRSLAQELMNDFGLDKK